MYVGGYCNGGAKITIAPITGRGWGPLYTANGCGCAIESLHAGIEGAGGRIRMELFCTSETKTETETLGARHSRNVRSRRAEPRHAASGRRRDAGIGPGPQALRGVWGGGGDEPP